MDITLTNHEFLIKEIGQKNQIMTFTYLTN
jgi:hypothetical protein